MSCAFSVDQYRRALAFAAKAHAGQLVPGTELPYVVHLVAVANEVLAAAWSAPKDHWDLDFAISCALLHDTLEDTATSEADVEATFGPKVLRGVRALTKDLQLPKQTQMADSLARILAEPREVAIVKLADRIANLAPPPAKWTKDKRIAYRQEAHEILTVLGPASVILRMRLIEKIQGYGAFIDPPS